MCGIEYYMVRRLTMSRKKIYENVLTKEFLLKEYIENKKSCQQISRETKISLSCVIKYLKNYYIEQRPKGLSAGMKYGKLTLIEIDGSNKNRSYIWKCLCECGNYTKTTTASLTSGNTKSCGCLYAVSGKQSIKWTGFEDISGKKWYGIKKHALNRNLNFNITIEQAWELFKKQEQRCYLSGVSIQFNKTSRNYSYSTASLDRINSLLGYEIDNVAWLHKDLNVMKHSLSIEELVHYCGLIVNFCGTFQPSNYNFITHKYYLSSIKSNAKKRNFTFDLTSEQIVQKFNDQGGICALTGLALVFPDSNSDFINFKHTASLDRINNDLGYSADNIQFVHKSINRSRSNFTIERYKELCKMVYLHNLPKI